MEGGRAVRHRRLDPGDGLEQAVVDLHQRSEVLRPVSVVGDHERHRLADVAHPPAREEGLGAAPDRRVPVAHHEHPVGEGEIVRRKHQPGPGVQRRRRIDGADLRVRMGAADEDAVQHAVEVDVVDEARPSAQQPRVLPARDRAADRPGIRHRRLLRFRQAGGV